jgi:glycosyltransferase involved in cell wall biosynthesis
MTPLFSVLIDTYNHQGYIEQAVVSAIEQDFPASDYEILVVDDGSTDHTPEIVRKFEPRVRLLRKENGGQASAINYGTAHAKGTFVAFLDGDDIWLPSKLSRVASEFEKNPNAVMVYHNFRFWDDRTNTTWDGWFTGVSGNVLADRCKLLSWSPPPTSSLAFRRSILMRLMPVPAECSFMHDGYLTSTAICLGSVGAIPESLTINRVHGQNLWFAEKGEPNLRVFKDRVSVRKAAMQSVRQWVRTNGSRSSRAQIRALMNVWQLQKESDEFHIRPPGNLRYFVHVCRHNLTLRPTMTHSHFFYNCVHALVSLIFGRENTRYLEGVRSRVKRLKLRGRAERQASQQ